MKLGKLIASPIRIINAPIRALEKVVGDDKKEDRIASVPIESLAEAIEEAVDGEESKDE